MWKTAYFLYFCWGGSIPPLRKGFFGGCVCSAFLGGNVAETTQNRKNLVFNVENGSGEALFLIFPGFFEGPRPFIYSTIWPSKGPYIGWYSSIYGHIGSFPGGSVLDFSRVFRGAKALYSTIIGGPLSCTNIGPFRGGLFLIFPGFFEGKGPI